jgi:hypothetical protein
MKKLLSLVLLLLAVTLFAFPVSALAEDTADATTGITASEAGTPAEPFTWQYLASIAGAAAFTLLVVQFLKAPLDKIWKIPTRVFAYIIALLTMLVATAFTTGLDIQTALLAVVNAFIAALTAYGAYEVTFAKLDNNK